MLRMGLVGAGPWATIFHGPLLKHGPDIEFVGTWARRPEAAQAIADAHGGAVFTEYDALLGEVDALVFSVPPNVQAEMAIQAAKAGKHLLLEKPLAMDLDSARALVAAVEESGVITQMVLTNRYRQSAQEFIDAVPALSPVGASGTWVASAGLEGEFFATPWRIAEGVLLDVGPHTLDLLDASLGPIVDIKALGHPREFLTLVCTHESGLRSTAVLSLFVGREASTTRFEVFGLNGKASYGETAPATEEFGLILNAIASQFVDAVQTKTPHKLDARRGLYLQELLQKAADQL